MQGEARRSPATKTARSFYKTETLATVVKVGIVNYIAGVSCYIIDLIGFDN